jgi:hypothetical protein
MQAASPLRRSDREAFLRDVADALQGRELGFEGADLAAASVVLLLVFAKRALK